MRRIPGSAPAAMTCDMQEIIELARLEARAEGISRGIARVLQAFPEIGSRALALLQLERPEEVVIVRQFLVEQFKVALDIYAKALLGLGEELSE